MIGWVKRRSTRTTTVLACLSLTTTPCSVRFGMSVPYFFASRFCAAMVLMRAMSRRASRSREVFSSCPVARWKRRLKRSFFRLRTASSLWSSLIARISSTFIGAMTLLRNARDEARLDRQLGGGERERLLGGLHRDAVDLENHAARLDPRHPQFRRTLAGAHADFGGLLRHRQVRKHADPDAAGALHVTGQCAARGFDLTGGDALGRHRLQAELTERQRRTRSRNAVDTALMRLPELRFLWLHHGFKPSNLLLMSHAASRRGRVLSPSAIFLSWAIGSCSRISPLKIQTLTPQVPNVVNAVATP